MAQIVPTFLAFATVLVLLVNQVARPGFDAPATGPSPSIAEPMMKPAMYTGYPQITAGDGHTCMVAVSQVGFCWGANSYYQLGDGTNQARYGPTVVASGALWITLQAGLNFTCGIKTDNTLWCWGNNTRGQVGDTTNVAKTAPTQVGTFTTWKSLTVSRNANACAITTGNQLYCWGWNQHGQIGNGVIGGVGAYVAAPTGPVGGTTQWKQVSSGYATTCAVRSDDTLWCWGINGYGMLAQGYGSGTMASTGNPMQLTTQAYVNPGTRRNVGGWSMVSVGFYTVCGIGLDTTAYCWGRGLYGQLGINDLDEMWDPWQVHTANPGWSDLRVGDDHTCGTLSDGRGYCWGRSNNKQTGIDSTTDQLVPVQVSGSYSMISGGWTHTCAITTDGWPKCWGSNSNGMAGRGDTVTPIGTPVNAYVPVSINSTPDNSTTEGDTGTKTLNMATNISAATNVPVTATWATSDGTATAGSDYTAGSGTVTFSPGTVATTMQVSISGDYVIESNETFSIALSNPSTNATISDGTSTGTITNDDVNVAPGTPSSLAQTKTNSSVITTGNWTTETSVRFTGTVADTSVPDTSALCVEAKPVGTAFTNAENACGTAATSSGAGLALEVTIGGLSNETPYHWQARAKDSYGLYSPWTVYGVADESLRDFGVDNTGPTTGVVLDGPTQGTDVRYNDGSSDKLAVNWGSFSDAGAGIASYQYAVGTTPGGTDERGWTAATASPMTITGLTLTTSDTYFVSVRATDNAGNTSSVVTANGQNVLPVLTFSLSASSIDFGPLDSGNGYSSTGKFIDVSVLTNSSGGYVVEQSGSPQMSSGASSVPLFGGTHASPLAWSGNGFAYTSNDTSILNLGDIFAGATKYARPTASVPGDVVADRPPYAEGAAPASPVTESYRLTYAVAAPVSQSAGVYTGSVVLRVTPTF